MIEKMINRLAKGLLDISSLWLFGIMLLVGTDVFLRYTFDSPISGALEISEQTVVILTFLCFAYTAIQNRHIRTIAVITRLPPSFRSLADFLALFMMILLLTLMVWQTSKEAWESFSIREVRMGIISVPIYPTKIAIPIGLFIAWIHYLLAFITQFKAARKIK
jgi:TRAP-type C4-dicarboxylate transport system permease small subunit